MRLTIDHVTTYRYSRAVPYEIETLRLTPRTYEGAAVVRWRVRGERDRALPSFVDGFGNVVHTNTINHPHEVTVIAVAGVVETRPSGGLVRDMHEVLPPGYFLRATPLTTPDAAIAALAADAVRGPRPLDRLVAVMENVRSRVSYRQGATVSETTAAEALALGAGVCQDHAHLFIAACRSLAVPARYVAGYLWPGENGTDEQAGHAWAEAFVDEIGWVGFDPSNRTLQDERYVRVGIGLDGRSAAPVRGIHRGGAAETLSVALDVKAAQAVQ
jgi:transglutaminase-like putative cysteine protease